MCVGRWSKNDSKNREKRDNCHGKKGQPAVVCAQPTQ